MKKAVKKAAVPGRKRGTGQHLRAKESVKPTAGKEPAIAKPLRPSQCRKYLRKELASSFRGIVDGFVEKAKSGSIQHVKWTTELLDDEGSRRQSKGSAELLLEEMRLAGESEEPVEVEHVWRE